MEAILHPGKSQWVQQVFLSLGVMLVAPVCRMIQNDYEWLTFCHLAPTLCAFDSDVNIVLCNHDVERYACIKLHNSVETQVKDSTSQHLCMLHHGNIMEPCFWQVLPENFGQLVHLSGQSLRPEAPIQDSGKHTWHGCCSFECCSR